MCLKNDMKILDLINAEIKAEFNDACNELRNEAKQQILKVQNENRKPTIFNTKELHSIIILWQFSTHILAQVLSSNRYTLDHIRLSKSNLIILMMLKNVPMDH